MIPTGVSRETAERLDIFVQELRRWQRAVNLVSPKTLDDVWQRHVEDCLQLSPYGPPAGTWVDLGSGAGLPGLILAAAEPARSLTLIESDGRKCAFLRHAAHAMGLHVDVREGRIEQTVPALSRAGMVTSRALAPLSRLLDMSRPLFDRGAVGLFLKGASHERELTEAEETWRFRAELFPSRTDSAGRVLRITDVQGRG